MRPVRRRDRAQVTGTISCPACGGSRIRVAAASRATGRRIARCRDCGAHYWANPVTYQGEPEPETGSVNDGLTAAGYSSWVDIKREQAGADAWRDTARWLRQAVPDSDDSPSTWPRLYDVGAGDGQFLQLARDEFGFTVSGNDVVPGAVALAAERNSVDLELGDLSDFDHRGDADAVTLWCVLAHVPDGNGLVAQVHAMLRPGGVVALQTPHWTIVDASAHLLQRITGGLISRLVDRRIASHHRILHTRRSVAAQLERHGFSEVVATAQPRYTLTSYAYLVSMNLPGWLIRPASYSLDRLIRSRVAPRIVLDVRARRV